MKLTDRQKVLAGNTLFFGFVAPYIGDFLLMPVSAMFTNILTHIFLPLFIGFIPALATGFLYGRAYLKAVEGGEVSTRSELLMSSKIGAVVMLTYSFLFFLLTFVWEYIRYSVSLAYLVKDMGWSIVIIIGAALIAAISAAICSNLISTWNLRRVELSKTKFW